MRDPLPQLRLSMVVPTFNESQNVLELLCRLESTLGPSGWEVIFVDDDSPDKTADIVRNIARTDHRVRCLLRIGRRGLASAAIEGMLAASADIIGVMDADLQHDEAMLPRMIAEIEDRGADVVVATRYKPGGGTGDWEEARKAISRVATAAGRFIIKHDLSDPMSGFFLLNRQALNKVVHRLSGIGFKILLDILASGNNHLRVSEVPYFFRNRFAGESKLDSMVAWEYGMLLADKTIGRFLPVRFIAFSIIGGLGVIVHLAVLTFSLMLLKSSFIISHSAATATAMIFNFALNNILTYRDKRLSGWLWFRGLITFVIACSIGALANIGIAGYLFQNRTQWAIASLAGVLVGAVWNYAVTRMYTWGRGR